MEYRETERGLAADFTLKLPYSLHSRPAAKIAQIARTFESDISLIGETGEVDAKSMLDLLSLAPEHNATLTLLAHGTDALQALEALLPVLASDKE